MGMYSPWGKRIMGGGKYMGGQVQDTHLHGEGTANWEVLSVLPEISPMTKAMSTLTDEVASLKHTASLSPGCDNSHDFLCNWNHLTVLEDWLSLLCVSATTVCSESQRGTHKPRGRGS